MLCVGDFLVSQKESELGVILTPSSEEGPERGELGNCPGLTAQGPTGVTE